MNTIELVITEENGAVRLTNLNDLKNAVETELESFSEPIYTANTLSEAKNERHKLNKLKESIERAKCKLRAVRKKYPQHEPELQSAQTLLEELYSSLNHPIMLVQEYIDYCFDERVKKRRRELMSCAKKLSSELGLLAEPVLASDAFWEKHWESTSCPIKTCRAEIKQKLERICADIAGLQNQPEAPALIVKYIETMSLKGLSEYQKKLRLAAGAELELNCEDNVRGYKTIRISGVSSELNRIVDDLKLMTPDIVIVEDGMPPRPFELTEPCFESFVAFDLETTGSLGIYSGDGRPEITEIGAVRVENGRITERFSQLCNPGRQITPTVVELTGITDEMVAKMPPVSEVIRRFISFARDSILLGHGIKDSDMIFLERAARREGIALQNSYFDTFRFAKRLEDRINADSLGLEALTRHFGIEHTHAHRALGDAEVTALLFEELKKLRGDTAADMAAHTAPEQQV